LTGFEAAAYDPGAAGQSWRGPGEKARCGMTSLAQEMVTVYDPTAEPRKSGAALAARTDDLRGKTIGVLDNGKANAGLLMTAVAGILKERYGAAEVIVRKKPVAGPASPQVIKELKEQCAAVLVGSAD
jgi:hypothetical protein